MAPLHTHGGRPTTNEAGSAKTVPRSGPPLDRLTRTQTDAVARSSLFAELSALRRRSIKRRLKHPLDDEDVVRRARLLRNLFEIDDAPRARAVGQIKLLTHHGLLVGDVIDVFPHDEWTVDRSFADCPGVVRRAQDWSPDRKNEANDPAIAVTTKIAQNSRATSTILPPLVIGFFNDEETLRI